MTLDDLRALLKRRRWTLQIDKRRRSCKHFFYAKKWVGRTRLTCYIGAESHLANLTEADVLLKLERKLEAKA